MSRTWRLSDRHERCGFDWCEIPPGQPMQVITLPGIKKSMLRCQAHAHGPVDWTAIEEARAAGDPFAERDAEGFTSAGDLGATLWPSSTTKEK